MAEKKYKNIKIDTHDGISWVTLEPPRKAQRHEPGAARGDGPRAGLARGRAGLPRCVVIRGAGGNFSAGQDLKEFFRANENNPRGRP